MGLHLPDAPPPDSDEEEDAEGAAAQRSRASIPMDAGKTRPPRISVSNIGLRGLYEFMTRASAAHMDQLILQTLECSALSVKDVHSRIL